MLSALTKLFYVVSRVASQADNRGDNVEHFVKLDSGYYGMGDCTCICQAAHLGM